MDAIASNDTIGSAYCGDIWQGENVQNRFHALRSHKQWYNPEVYQNFFNDTLRALYHEKQDVFYANIEKSYEVLKNRYTETRQKHKAEQEKQKAKEKTKQVALTKESDEQKSINELQQKIKDAEKRIKKAIPAHLNKDGIQKRQVQIMQWKESITTITKQRDQKNMQGKISSLSLLPSQDDDRCETIQKEMNEYEAILHHKDTSSSLYLAKKASFIAEKKLDEEAVRIIK